MATVGWIGLGAMGSPMARVVALAGHPVQAFDIDPQRPAALADDGVVAVASPAEAAAGVKVLAIMVATPEQGESALFGDKGAAGALGPAPWSSSCQPSGQPPCSGGRRAWRELASTWSTRRSRAVSLEPPQVSFS